MPPARRTLIPAYVGANVKAWRLRRELTQEALAEAAEIDIRFVQKIERGTVDVGVTVLVALADALLVQPGVLLRAAAPGPEPKRGRPSKTTRVKRQP